MSDRKYHIETLAIHAGQDAHGDRATMTNLILGLDGFTVALGVHAKAYNPAIVSVPLKLDDTITVGIIRRSGIQPSAAAEAFVSAVRRLIAAK